MQGDSVKLDALCSILLDNAVKYSDEGGKISLRTSENYNASELCKALGGGGHAAAAGATVPGGITGARHAILSLLAQRGIIRER